MIRNQIRGSEDCLYLNVYKPITHQASRMSVMVWIHGGAFIEGSGDDEIYGPEYFMRKDVILVAINYRLGVLGKWAVIRITWCYLVPHFINGAEVIDGIIVTWSRKRNYHLSRIGRIIPTIGSLLDFIRRKMQRKQNIRNIQMKMKYISIYLSRKFRYTFSWMINIENLQIRDVAYWWIIFP